MFILSLFCAKVKLLYFFTWTVPACNIWMLGLYQSHHHSSSQINKSMRTSKAFFFQAALPTLLNHWSWSIKLFLKDLLYHERVLLWDVPVNLMITHHSLKCCLGMRQSMFEPWDCSERVGYALAVQQHSLVEGTVPDEQQKYQELLLGAWGREIFPSSSGLIFSAGAGEQVDKP